MYFLNIQFYVILASPQYKNKEVNKEKSDTIGGLNLPVGKEPSEEEDNVLLRV